MSRSKNKEIYSRNKIESNRRNALRSTGPKSPEGKQAARWNALRHGLLARELVIPNGAGREDENEFRELLAGLLDDWRPAGTMEDILVEEIAVSYWRLRRVIRSENGRIRQAFEHDARMDKALRLNPTDDDLECQHARLSFPQARDADQILRYGAAIERALFRALQHLERLQRRRREAEREPGRSREQGGSREQGTGNREQKRQESASTGAGLCESGSDTLPAERLRARTPALPNETPHETTEAGSGESGAPPGRSHSFGAASMAFLPNEPRLSFGINAGYREPEMIPEGREPPRCSV